MSRTPRGRGRLGGARFVPKVTASTVWNAVLPYIRRMLHHSGGTRLDVTQKPASYSHHAQVGAITPYGIQVRRVFGLTSSGLPDRPPGTNNNLWSVYRLRSFRAVISRPLLTRRAAKLRQPFIMELRYGDYQFSSPNTNV